MAIVGYAPAKAILFGEHYVVYGAEGIACGITPYNRVEIEARDAEGGAFHYSTSVGCADVDSEGKFTGEKSLAPAAAVYLGAKKSWGRLGKIEIYAKAVAAWPLKGVGNSASISAALACGLAEAAGEKPGRGEIFALAQESDSVAHGGSPSGIDAMAVARGGAIMLQKKFTNPPKFEFSSLEFRVPGGWKFLLIDTFVPDSGRANTADQIAKFAKVNVLAAAPGALDGEERKKVTEKYGGLEARAKQALLDGNMADVGALMDENHSMLVESGMSCDRIEKAVSVAKSNGAAGAKLTGAGGEGGAVIALCQDGKAGAVSGALRSSGFAAYQFEISKKGAWAEKK